MMFFRKRGRLGAILAFVVLAFGLSPASAVAAPEDTFVTFSGEGGDSITGDLTWFYDRSNSQIITSSFENNRVHIRINGDTFWFLDFAAPVGAPLQPGIYEGATRYPFQAPTEPGLSLSGNGRGCNTLTGSFEVIEATFGPHGFVERFHATFEQHCEGSVTSRALGEVLIDNGPAPELLVVEVLIDDSVLVSEIGRATVSGTVTCSKPTHANIGLTLAQRVNRRLTTTGSTFFQIPCTSEPTPISIQLSAQPAPYNPGQAQLDVGGNAFDSDYGVHVFFQSSSLIKLTRAK
ncbi:MAG: hypothetical protein ACRDVK_02240 [Acidimicrobiia bacterium]